MTDDIELIRAEILPSLRKSFRNARRFVSTSSNPPYQVAAANDNGATGIYHFFMDVAKQFSDLVSMIYPAKWIHAGRGEGLNNFRNSEIVSKHYVKFVVDSKDSAVFANVTIKGGTNYFLWDKSESDSMILEYNGESDVRESILDSMPEVILDRRYRTIINKVSHRNHIQSEVRSYYGTNLMTSKEIEALSHVESDEIVHIYYYSFGEGIKRSSIPASSTTKATDDYKVFSSRTADPDPNSSFRRAGRIFVGKPNEICSNTFLKIGSFKTVEEANNCLLYLKTDFVGFMFGVIQTTQNVTRKSYTLVPDIDFLTGEVRDKPNVFLDFTIPASLDEQLFEIFGISENEKSLIKAAVRPWKDKLDLELDGVG